MGFATVVSGCDGACLRGFLDEFSKKLFFHSVADVRRQGDPSAQAISPIYDFLRYGENMHDAECLPTPRHVGHGGDAFYTTMQ